MNNGTDSSKTENKEIEKTEKTEKKDIFDRIMSLGIFSFIRPFYQKHKEDNL